MSRPWRIAVGAGALATATLLLCGASSAFAQTSDLTTSKSAPATAAADTDLAYTITVTNLGPDSTTAGNTTLTDTLPAGTTFVSLPAPAGWSCSTPAVGANGTVSCQTTAPMGASASATFSLTAHVAPGTPPGTFITNIATVSDPTDPDPENDSGVAATQVSGGTSADLAVTKTAPDNVGIGQNFNYTIVVANNGP